MLSNAKIRNPFPMIGKVYKYEFKSGARTILPLYGVMMILALVCGIFFSDIFKNYEIEKVKFWIGFLFGAACFAAFVLTVLLIEKRFKKGLLEDEAYLNMTLPVTMTEHIIGRLLTFSVWFLMFEAASIISFNLICISIWPKVFADHTISELFQDFYNQYGLHLGSFILMGIFFGLSILLLCITFIFVVNTISHLFKKNRILCEIILVVVLIIAFSNITSIFFSDLQVIDFDSAYESMKIVYRIFWRALIINFVTVIINVIVTQKVLKTGFNLD